MSTGEFSLEWLLDPVTPAEFFNTHYEKQPLHVSRGDAGRFAKLLSVDAVDELLTATVSDRSRPAAGERLIRSDPDGTLSERTLRLTGNAAVDIQGVYRLYDDGYTVVLNQLHRRSAAIGRLCRGLQATLHHPVGANAYLTPALAQGFLPHVDTHDVLILQLHGAKEWHVSNPPTQLPLAQARHGRQGLPDSKTYALQPGDLFYLPRGYRHAAVAGDSSSLHLTVGIYALRWHDLVKETLDLLAEDDVAFRGALPPQFIDEPLDMAVVLDLSARLSAALSNDAHIARAKERIASRVVTGDATIGQSRFRSLDALATLGSTSVVTRPSDAICLIRPDGDQVTIEFAGNFVAGPSRLEAAFRFIARSEQFPIGELPGGLSQQEKIDLVKRLVSEGLLEVAGT